ncbi:MAG: NAD-dependent epimerase/dehydratase family protein [Treponema sp.]|jgi:dihydroflavonol-4-reductase|nr:NAD-dependent epimerase/dehydratase family protein [Treponema sp.]
MKILVTGADGLLGSNLVRELLNRNHLVSVLLLEGTKSPTLDGLPITSYYGNILKPESLDAPFKNNEIVIHCAAATDVYPARNEFVNAVNIEGSRNIVKTCLKHSIKRLVYVGTANSFSFGTSKDKPGVEDTPYASLHYGLDYMDSKRYAQELVLEAVKNEKLPAVIVNPTFMIGPYDSRPSSGKMILALHKGKVPGYTNGGKNYVAVKDVAAAISNAIDKGRIGECYILGNENLSYKEAFEKLANAIGAKPPKLKMGNVIVKFYGTLSSLLAKIFKLNPAVTKEMAIISCDHHYYSVEKARKELDLPQTPIETAAKECFEWFKENDYLTKKI